MLFGAFAFSACSDDDNYQPGLPAGENNVTFLSYSYPVMEKTATTFDVVAASIRCSYSSISAAISPE